MKRVDKRLCCELYAAGKSTVEVGRLMGISTTLVRMIVRDSGGVMRRRGRPAGKAATNRWAAADTAVKRLHRYLDALGPDVTPSRAEAARHVGISRARIYQICHEAPDIAARLPARQKNRKCRICGAKHYSLGLCIKHHRRLQRHGDPLVNKDKRGGGLAICDDCGASSHLAGDANQSKYLRRNRCSDGKMRCQKCTRKSDPEFRVKYKTQKRTVQDRKSNSRRCLRSLRCVRSRLCLSSTTSQT